MIEEKLLAKLREQQTAIERGLVEVPATSYEKYLQLVGKHQGLEIAIEELTALIRDDDEK